jgi:small conductance mechanosensitive channel
VRIIVPNSDIYGSTITNYSAYETRRNDIVLGVSYDDDLSVVDGVIRKVLEAESRVLEEPEYQVVVGGLGDSSVDFYIRPWCASSDYWPLRFDLTRRLKEEIEAAGCSIPFPQRDIHVHRNGEEA